MQALDFPTAKHGYSLLYCYGYPLKKSQGDLLIMIYSSIGLRLWPGVFSGPSQSAVKFSFCILRRCWESALSVSQTSPLSFCVTWNGYLCTHMCPYQSHVILMSMDLEELRQSTVYANTQD